MNLEIIILAAGKGTRMKSRLPKVLHLLAGKPLLEHVVLTAQQLDPLAIHVVTGHESTAVRAALRDYQLNWVEQAEQKGTGHAVQQALPSVSQGSVVLVVYGDVPLLSSESLERLSALAKEGPALLTAELASPKGYGRILRGAEGELLGVVEEKDASDSQKRINEINTGVLAIPQQDLQHYLPRVTNNNSQGEFYLPDILGMAAADGKKIATCFASSEYEVLGVNDQLQLNQAERQYQRNYAERLMRQGVRLADAERIDIRGELICGDDVVIDVNAVFSGKVVLGFGVTIGPNCVISDTTIESNVTINAMSHLQEAIVGEGCSVGPYARLRPGTILSSGSRVGNFVETKNAHIGANSKVNHLSYIGDCTMGKDVNIGAGTITCNYDGVNKHRTELGDGVFIGSNSTLVAPITVADHGFTAAGSTITRAVGPAELAVTRAKQRNVQGWKRPQKNTDRD